MKRTFSARAMIAACLASGLLAAACASVAPSAPLENTRWAAQSINGRPVLQRTPTLEFAGDRVAGTSGCNRFFGMFTLSGESGISIGQIGSTEMACEPAVMEQEGSYFAALGAVTGFARDEDALVLTGEHGERIVFAPAQ